MKTLSFLLLIAWSAIVLRPTFQELTFERAEAARIRAHLARVESALRGRDDSRWNAEQRQARARNLDRLRAYWTAGVFPHNHDFRGERVPYFIDRHGTRCAMAYLIEQSGGAALVRRVAHSANNARVKDLAGDPELVAWLDGAGMTAAEAACVQPEYQDPPIGIIVNDHDDLESYARITATTTAVEVAAVIANLQSRWNWEARRAAGTMGLVVGFGGVIVGIAGIIDNDQNLALGFTNMAVGALSIGAGIRNLNSAPSNTRSAALVADVGSVRVGIAPRLAIDGRPQLALSMGF